MEFTSESGKTTFTLPDKPRGRDILAYEQHFEGSGLEMYPRLWAAACAVVGNWHGPVELSPALLDAELSPDELTEVKWAALAVFSWYLNWRNGNLPKN